MLLVLAVAASSVPAMLAGGIASFIGVLLLGPVLVPRLIRLVGGLPGAGPVRRLATGNAGWTTAGDLPARWVIHVVGPNWNAGERDRSLLESCYSGALAVADELGARTVAFPLVSAGIYGWPKDDAVAAAVETLRASPTQVEEARLVAFDAATYELIGERLTPR